MNFFRYFELTVNPFSKWQIWFSLDTAFISNPFDPYHLIYISWCYNAQSQFPFEVLHPGLFSFPTNLLLLSVIDEAFTSKEWLWHRIVRRFNKEIDYLQFRQGILSSVYWLGRVPTLADLGVLSKRIKWALDGDSATDCALCSCQ